MLRVKGVGGYETKARENQKEKFAAFNPSGEGLLHKA